MALDARIHFKTFVRTNKNPNVRPEDWARMFETYQPGLNFDGELWGLGHPIDDLIKIGLRGPEDPLSECSWNSSVKGYATWLRRLRVIPDIKNIDAFDAWTIKDTSCTLVQCQWSGHIFCKDVNCQWEYY